MRPFVPGGFYHRRPFRPEGTGRPPTRPDRRARRGPRRWPHPCSAGATRLDARRAHAAPRRGLWVAAETVASGGRRRAHGPRRAAWRPGDDREASRRAGARVGVPGGPAKNSTNARHVMSWSISTERGAAQGGTARVRRLAATSCGRETARKPRDISDARSSTGGARHRHPRARREVIHSIAAVRSPARRGVGGEGPSRSRALERCGDRRSPDTQPGDSPSSVPAAVRCAGRGGAPVVDCRNANSSGTDVGAAARAGRGGLADRRTAARSSESGKRPPTQQDAEPGSATRDGSHGWPTKRSEQCGITGSEATVEKRACASCSSLSPRAAAKR